MAVIHGNREAPSWYPNERLERQQNISSKMAVTETLTTYLRDDDNPRKKREVHRNVRKRPTK
jgi:hypothetical protein